LNEHAERQLIHLLPPFRGFARVCRTLAIAEPAAGVTTVGLTISCILSSPTPTYPFPVGADVLAHVRAFLEGDKERCRCGLGLVGAAAAMAGAVAD